MSNLNDPAPADLTRRTAALVAEWENLRAALDAAPWWATIFPGLSGLRRNARRLRALQRELDTFSAELLEASDASKHPPPAAPGA